MLRIAVILAMLLVPASTAATEAGWALLRNGGQLVLITHAHAPPAGDPAFIPEDCAMQRALSERGRQQARRMGALFYARAAPIEVVLTSRQCRTIETAEIAFRDSLVEVFEALDYFPLGSEEGEAQTEEVLERIREYRGAGNLLMVTHQPNIEALAGIRPREGEAVILSPASDTFGVAARITFN